MLRERARGGVAEAAPKEGLTALQQSLCPPVDKQGTEEGLQSKKEPLSKKTDVFSKQSHSAHSADIYTEAGNINFFKDLETGKGIAGGQTNKDHEAEERAEKEKYEKQIGLLTYLGQDSLEANKSKAWYVDDNKCVSALWAPASKRTGELHPPEHTTDSSDPIEELNDTIQHERDKDVEVGLKYKKFHDPLNDIIKYTGWKPTKSIPAQSLLKSGEEKEKLERLLDERNKLDEEISEQINKSNKHDENLVRKKVKSKKHRTKPEEIKETSKRKRKHRSSDVSRKYKRTKYDTNSSDSDNSRRRSRSHKHRSKNRKHERDSCSGDSSRHSRSKHRHRSKSRHRSRQPSGSSGSDSSEGDIEHAQREQQMAKLRKERLTREAAERLRAQRLLSGQDPDNPTPKAPANAGKQKYNAQFNPMLARQNKEDNVLKTGVKYF